MCSFLAAIMFSAAFGLSSLEISLAPEYSERPNTAVAQRLTIYFAMAGLGTVLSCASIYSLLDSCAINANDFSYFSFVFSATKTFTRYLTIASGVTMSLFGLSPLLLSSIASNFFSDATTGSLDVTRFLQFLAVATGVVHLAGAYALTVPSTTTTLPSPTSEPDDERSRLLDNEHPAECATDPRDGSAVDLLRDPNFWLLALYMIMVLGSVNEVFHRCFSPLILI